MPVYPNSKKEYFPPKKFLWDLFSTIDNDLALKFVKHSIDKRADEEVAGDKTIEVAEEILAEVKTFNYFSKKKGKALHMMKAKKEYTTIQRKRRKQIDSFNPTHEESKESPSKRVKRAEPSDSERMISLSRVKTKSKNEKEKRLGDDSLQREMEIDSKPSTVPRKNIPNPFK